jgi:hypothetical protein
MAVTDWNFGPHGPEILTDIGTVGLKRTLGYPRITADFGGGYFAEVRVGLDLRRWSLTWAAQRHNISENPHKVIPVYDDGTIVEGPSAGAALTFVIDPAAGSITTNATYGDMQSRMKYLQRFFARRMMSTSTPFVFVDPAERGDVNWNEPYNYATAFKWLVRFTNPELVFTQVKRADMWNWSADIIEVRPGYY